MKSSECLIKAQELIRDPERICIGTFSKTSQGQFCAMGAVREISLIEGTSWNKGIDHLYEAASEWLRLHHCPADSRYCFVNVVKRQPVEKMMEKDNMAVIPYVNDFFGHEAVMEVFAMAIEAALEKELKEEEYVKAVDKRIIKAMKKTEEKELVNV